MGLDAVETALHRGGVGCGVAGEHEQPPDPQLSELTEHAVRLGAQGVADLYRADQRAVTGEQYDVFAL